MQINSSGRKPRTYLKPGEDPQKLKTQKQPEPRFKPAKTDKTVNLGPRKK